MKNISKIFVKLLVFLTVIGIIFILMQINTKLLLYLNWYKIGHGLDNYFALISGTAYALGSISVVIWYNPKLELNAGKEQKKKFRLKYIGSVLLKLSFVILDGIHVYIYQNINVSDTVIPEVASLVFGIQTILILYFIGSVVDNIIKHPDKKQTDYKKLQTDFNTTTEKYNSLKTDFSTLKSEFRENENKLNLLQTDIKEKESKIVNFKSELELLQTHYDRKENQLNRLQEQFEKQKETIQQKNKHIAMLEKYYFKSERSRILKKNPENRTEEEQKILTESEKY